MERHNVGILIFENVEVLDFAGPFEVRSLGLLESLDTGATVERELRVVDDVVVTSAGVASGIDMAFYMVERLCGREVADETARYIEYRRSA